MSPEELTEEQIGPEEGTGQAIDNEPDEGQKEEKPVNSKTGNPLSDESVANLEKYGVTNPKGRVASILSLILWSMLLLILAMNGDWTIGPLLLAICFVLLLVLSTLRFYQEWVEGGDWLDD